MDDLWITFKLADYFRRGSHKVAISLPELVSQTNQFSIKNRPGCVPSLQRSNPQSLYLGYNVKCHLKNSDPNGHDVAIQFDLSQVNKDTLAKNLDCKVSCSCVAPETMIRMADGTEKRIDQVQVGEYVLTHKGRARKVTAVMSRPSFEGELAWEVKAEGYRDPLILSDDHPLGVVRGHELCACGCGEPLYPLGYKNVTTQQRWARKFVKGHWRSGYCREEPDLLSEGVFKWKEPFSLVERERLYFPKIVLDRSIDVDPLFAGLVGYYTAEGHAVLREKKRGRWGHDIEGAKSKDVEVRGVIYRAYTTIFTLNQNELNTIAADIKFRVHAIYGPETRVDIKKRESKGRKWLNVIVYQPDLTVALVKLAGVGSANKQFSPEVMQWGEQALMQLVACYAMGDGYVGDDGQCVFSTSRNLITQVSTILFSLGIWHNFTYHHKKTLNINGEKYKPNFRLNWDYRQFPLLLVAMTEVMRKYDATRMHSRLTKEFCQGDLRYQEWGPGFIRTMKSKKRVKAPRLYWDLEVEEDASFIANGLTAHNCPAYLFYAGQWNSYQRDALEGEPRPLLTAPTERLDFREDFVICKHIKAVSERILPSVQHNIVKILRQRDIEQRKDQEKRTPERLEKGQEKLRDKQKNKGLEQDKADVRKQLEKGLQQRQAPPAVVKRDTPATPDEKTRVKKIDPAEVPTPSTAQPSVTPPAQAPPAPSPAPAPAPTPTVKAPAPPKPPKPAPKPLPKRKPRKVNSPLDADIDLDEEI